MSDQHYDDPIYDDTGEEITPLDIFMAPYRGIKKISKLPKKLYKEARNFIKPYKPKVFKITEDGKSISFVQTTPTPIPTPYKLYDKPAGPSPPPPHAISFLKDTSKKSQRIRIKTGIYF